MYSGIKRLDDMTMVSVTHILIVDDDPEIRTLLAKYLSSQGFRVSMAADRREFVERIASSDPDLIVLDVMLPDGSGLDICRDLQGRRPRTPVILLTALKEDVDRIVGLEIGADDYLGKPFNPRELTARIKAVLRRAMPQEAKRPSSAAYVFADFTADPEQRSVIRAGGEKIELTGAEFDLLKVFLDRPGRLLSRDQLLDLTQGKDRGPFDRSIDVLMSRLRKKLDAGTPTPIFKTVRNGGYQMTVQVKTLPVQR
ncbi:response regulator transcription factor [Agrobacterium tumefaciens]|nr:DNA-binding response regulator [Agrobacterium tumefaciens]QNP82467.1 response regulator transcription factor [Agrobacterium tumefaciens]UXS27027.1 response regulator transcription factor [Agrobacterium tumefaciens]UXS54474.1 response regulator transcription factor [Agrobacterium tumefaciens]UXS65552.1 response regulator transcription factor [Agrobacterium tumefaciens]